MLFKSFNRLFSGLYSPLTISLNLVLLLGIMSPALANYVPPSEPSSPPPSSTGTGGTRGGCGNNLGEEGEGLPFLVLAPQNHVGQTAATHPTVAWFVPDEEEYLVELFLDRYSEDASPQRVHSTEIPSEFGVMSYTLPDHLPALTPGDYRWRVVLVCDSNRPSSSPVADADLQVVASQRFAEESADAYAEAGLWYDALAAALETSEQLEWRSLLEDLSSLEDDERANKLLQISELDL